MSTCASLPGEIIALCGPTGAGKTSLLNLLPRFYDPTAGSVRIGGVDIRDVPIEELRRTVAIVTQRPILFSVPLRDNVTAARPDAPWDEVLAACDAAGVAQFADELPDGFDTLIGERGVNLSGGQRQRVALARALVAGARVIVLDDPMSAVDTQTERHLVTGLRPALAGPHRADRGAAALDRPGRGPGGRARRRRDRRGRPGRTSCSPRTVRSQPSSERKSLPRKAHTGLSRLGRYLPGHRLRVAVLSVVGIFTAAAPVERSLRRPGRDRQGHAAHDRARLDARRPHLSRDQRARLGAADDARPRPRAASARISCSRCAGTSSTT